MPAQYQVHGAIAVITLDNPPVNGLGWELRQSIVQGVERACADAAVQAIILTGAGTAFSGGADIREFGTPKMVQPPNLRTVIDVVEAATKPVIAALHSVVMGGGLELALGCHYRIVAPGTQIAFPEVKLGLLPGAGGTQRLPRALGVENALNLIVSGQTIKSDLLAFAPHQKLFDKMALSAETLLEEAEEFAADVVTRHATGAPLPRLRDLPCKHPQSDAYFEFARNTIEATAPHYPAPLKCIDAVEIAATKPFDEGMAREQQFFGELLMSPESAALRHVFFSERAAAKIPGVDKSVPPRAIRRVGVVGAGTMGGGIAMNFLNAGIPVTMLEVKQEALDHGLSVMRKNYEDQVKKGKLKADKYAQRMALLTTTLQYADLKDCDIVIEAVFEKLEVKQAVFKELDAVLKPGAILASNTSTLDINQIAAVTGRPQDVVGTHFFSPANVMRLLEVVHGQATAPDVLVTIMALAKKIRKTAVLAGVCDGFIGNRMVEQYLRQALFLVDEGASVEQVDKAAEKFGFVMGPFRVADLAGNDIGWAIRKGRAARGVNIRYSGTADSLCELGRFGQKTSAGWYDYAPGKRKPIASPVVAELIAKYRADNKIPQRKIASQEITDRLVYALVNEGARILEEGIASKASDIDMVYIMGYGFPPFRGGPMFHADQQGLLNVARAMRGFARNPLDDQAFWQPAPLLQKLAQEGGAFNKV